MRMRAPLAVQRPESALFETYAADDVAFGPKNQGLSGRPLVDRVRAAMDRVGLPYEGYRDRSSRSLSGGERRRLALAGVLALEPEALLLDEPTQALDPTGKATIMDLITAFAARGGTVVFSTHSMDEAALADRVAVLRGGELLAFGSPIDIFGKDYDESWGIGRPWAAEVAAALEGLGHSLGATPLAIEELAGRFAAAAATAATAATAARGEGARR
jgi:energy-coupling factor transport system ATP-binding protein